MISPWARATWPSEPRPNAQARGLPSSANERALARGMALRGMAGRPTPEQFATPYGGLCKQREDAHEAQDDDDPNDGRRPRQLARPRVQDRLAPCLATGTSRRDHERIGTAAA
jgi:hypothetical protein